MSRLQRFFYRVYILYIYIYMSLQCSVYSLQSHLPIFLRPYRMYRDHEALSTSVKDWSRPFMSQSVRPISYGWESIPRIVDQGHAYCNIAIFSRPYVSVCPSSVVCLCLPLSPLPTFQQSLSRFSVLSVFFFRFSCLLSIQTYWPTSQQSLCHIIIIRYNF